MKDLLSKVTVRDLERMLEIKRREESIAPLLRKREELLRELAALEKQINRHHGLKAGTPGRVAEEAGEPAETGSGRRGRRALSDAARERIAAAQRARWAKARKEKPDAPPDGESTPPASPEASPDTETPASAGPDGKPPKKKRTLSPEARARIVAAQKARWAKTKESKGTKETETTPEAAEAEAPPVAETPAPEAPATPKPARKPRKKRVTGPEPSGTAEPAESAPPPPEKG
jgi:hypothetical protein